MWYVLYVLIAILTLAVFTIYNKIDEKVNPIEKSFDYPCDENIFFITVLLSLVWPLCLGFILIYFSILGFYKLWNYMFDNLVEKIFSFIKTLKK